MYKQLHILLSYSLYWQYAGEKWLIKNRGFEDDEVSTPMRGHNSYGGGI